MPVKSGSHSTRGMQRVAAKEESDDDYDVSVLWFGQSRAGNKTNALCTRAAAAPLASTLFA